MVKVASPALASKATATKLTAHTAQVVAAQATAAPSIEDRIKELSAQVASLTASNAQHMAALATMNEKLITASATSTRATVHGIKADMKLIGDAIEAAAEVFSGTQLTDEMLQAIADRLLVTLSARIGNTVRQELIGIMPKVTYNDGSQPGQRAKAEQLDADELVRITRPATLDTTATTGRMAEADEVAYRQWQDAKGNTQYACFCTAHVPMQRMARKGDVFVCSSCDIVAPVAQIVGEMPKSKRGMGMPKEEVHVSVATTTKPVSVVKAAQAALQAQAAPVKLTPMQMAQAAMVAKQTAVKRIMQVQDADGNVLYNGADDDAEAIEWAEAIAAMPDAGFSITVLPAVQTVTSARPVVAPVVPETPVHVAAMANVATGLVHGGKGWQDATGFVHPVFTGAGLFPTANTPQSIAFAQAVAAGHKPYATCSCGNVLSKGFKCNDGSRHIGKDGMPNPGKGVIAV